MSKKTKLWSGRFSGPTSEMMEKFSSSIACDKRLYKEDIMGSIAHARMLHKIEILSKTELSEIEQGLKEIENEIEQGTFSWTEQSEDIHMDIEVGLTDRIGEVGKKLHTGRSRNDQIATDMRLYLRTEIEKICGCLSDLQLAMINFAESYHDAIMPGYTHMQPAQPVTLGHHVLAWNEMFQRDYERFVDCQKRVNVSPLGCAALAGTSFPVDREMTSRQLGFDRCATNSLDAVSDRDFIIEFSAHAAVTMVHLSRISEELILWSSSSFNFVDLGDAFCTGSSIMPQKKNPDAAEITRGKTARVIGNLTALLILMKAQPLAYNRDNQEDKEQLFDSIDTLTQCLNVFIAMIPQIKTNLEVMYAAAAEGYSTATDLADYLVMQNIPFRQAHEIVGKVVVYAINKQCQLSELSLSELKNFSDKIEQDVFDVLSVEGSVNARNHIGGTAPQQVKKAIVDARKRVTSRKCVSHQDSIK